MTTKLSHLIITHPEVGTFAELVSLVERRAGAGEILLHFDLKPEFPDTPRNWEWLLEAAFYRGER